MPRSTCYLAVFDISLDRERVRLAKCLEGFGFRIQKSVFECRLTRSGKERLLQATRKLELKSGCLLLYKIGPEFRRQEVGNLGTERFSDQHHSFDV